jgi:hypothetical protein
MESGENTKYKAFWQQEKNVGWQDDLSMSYQNSGNQRKDSMEEPAGEDPLMALSPLSSPPRCFKPKLKNVSCFAPSLIQPMYG